MTAPNKKNFDELTQRLLTEHAGFAHAVARIVSQEKPSGKAEETARRTLRELDQRHKQNPIEAFCPPT